VILIPHVAQLLLLGLRELMLTLGCAQHCPPASAPNARIDQTLSAAHDASLTDEMECEAKRGSRCSLHGLAATVNASNTLPGIAPHLEYPEVVSSTPSATAGPPMSIEPP
jgi:hypothetical protein